MHVHLEVKIIWNNVHTILTCIWEERKLAMLISVSSVVEFPGAGSSRLRIINSELNGAT